MILPSKVTSPTRERGPSQDPRRWSPSKAVSTIPPESTPQWRAEFEDVNDHFQLGPLYFFLNPECIVGGNSWHKGERLRILQLAYGR